MTAADRITESTSKSANQPCISAADLFHGAPAELFSDKKDMPNVVSNGHLNIAALHFDTSTSDLPMNPQSSLEPLPGVGSGGWNHVVKAPPELPVGPGPIGRPGDPATPISELPTPTPGTMEPLPGVGVGGWNHVIKSPPELPGDPGSERNRLNPIGFPLPPGDPTSPPERPEPIGNPIKPWREGGGDGIYNPRAVIKDLLHTGLQIVT
jgi:hypothetical protein